MSFQKANKINLFSFNTPQMRAFHMSWFAFFLCFFAWFGIAPLMPVVRDELGLTKSQIGNIIIASVSVTIFFRLFMGWLCDKIGPRLSYTWLLCLGSIPVMCIGLANTYESFLIARLCIGAIGASFVITQVHTSRMFSKEIVGTANATTAGWGNLGGGVTQMVMPVLFTAVIAMGFAKPEAWRISMMIVGALCFLVGVAYFFLTQDTPEGNFKDIPKEKKVSNKGAFLAAVKDFRVWVLFIAYAACFGVELTMNNVAALYFVDNFEFNLKTAGVIASLFGLMNIFARTLGGYIGDKFGKKSGLNGRVKWLFIVLMAEACALLIFSQMLYIPLVIGTLVLFSMSVQMAEGATYSIVPFVNKKALGPISGIVGAGGNVGAVMAGFLFKGKLEYSQAFTIMGVFVLVAGFLTLAVRFTTAEEKEFDDEVDSDLAMAK